MAHNHSHPHSHEPSDEPRQRLGDEMDPASRSLAEALRVSFRLLSVVMLLLVVAYVASGMFTVEDTERAVVVRFGRIVGGSPAEQVLSPGLQFSWPFPIGRVVRVPTSEQTVGIDTFWYNEPPNQAGRPPTPRPEPIRPGLDGALMTSDRGLVHVRWDVTYVIPPDQPQRIVDFVLNVPTDEADAVVRLAVENASIEVAAGTPVDEILRQQTSIFRERVRMNAQQQLDAIGAGVVLRAVDLGQYAPTAPLAARAAFDRVNTAEQDRDRTINEARRDATRQLVETAGQHYADLEAAIDDYDLAMRSAGILRKQLREAVLGEDPNLADPALLELYTPYPQAVLVLGINRRLVRQRLIEAIDVAPELEPVLLDAVAAAAKALTDHALGRGDEAAANQAIAAVVELAGAEQAEFIDETFAIMREQLQVDLATVAAAGETLEAFVDADLLANDLDAALAALGRYDRVGELLISGRTSGRAAELIAQARSSRESVLQQARQEYARYEQLLGQYIQSPDLMIDRLWMRTFREVLAQESAIKEFVPDQAGTYVLQVNTDPEALRRLRRQRIERTQQQAQQQAQQQRMEGGRQ